mmetsp:Transcript_34187/g.76979  ORF Transcript_34187/g.76979 Transcript_34187/m.76979 type:complete len:92 (+) Transcript_34187:581-856(+)
MLFTTTGFKSLRLCWKDVWLSLYTTSQEKIALSLGKLLRWIFFLSQGYFEESHKQLQYSSNFCGKDRFMSNTGCFPNCKKDPGRWNFSQQP